MRLLISLAFAVGLLAVASALTCKVCSFRALSICFTSSSVKTCNGSCSLTKASLGDVSLFNKQDCATDCKASNKTETDSVFNIDYKVSCCKTDECNSGTSAKLSLSLGLGLALLWLVRGL